MSVQIKDGYQWFFLHGFFLIHLLAVLCYPVIDVDSAKYTSISMEMLQNGSFLEVNDRLTDYLDKPPMLFWVSSIFLLIFGLKCWAYKLGSYIFLFLASTCFRQFLVSETNQSIANNWLLVWFSSIGFSYLILDVKTEPLLLTSLLITYPSLVDFVRSANIRNTIIASIGIAIGLLSKGPITIVVLGALILPFFITYIRHQFHMYWFILIAFVAILISPMLYGLYQQFDLHPDKVVNTKTQVSGLRFYFWEQSFGRITGENQWKNQHDAFFLVHSLILFSLPFIHYAVAGIYQAFRYNSNRIMLSYSMLSGIVIPIILLSTSHYQLPHYAFVSLPFLIYFAVVHYDKIHNWSGLRYINYFFFTSLTGISIALIYLCSYDLAGIKICLSLVMLILGVYLIFKLKDPLQQLASSSVMCFSIIILTIGSLFSKYQPGNQIEALVERNHINNSSELSFYNRVSDSAEFHLGHRIPVASYEEIIHASNNNTCKWYYMADDALQMFIDQKRHISKVDSIQFYDVNRIKLKFLLIDKRQELIETLYVVQIGSDCM